MEKLKHYNFQLWGWFVYQWWIAESIKHCIKNINSSQKISRKIIKLIHKALWKDENTLNEIEKYFKTIEKIIIESFWIDVLAKEIDILLEWDWNCFEDINILHKSKKTNKTSMILIQVKWWNTNSEDSEINNEKVLETKKRKKLYWNLIKNINIPLLEKNIKIIIISNKEFSWPLNNFTEWKLDSNRNIKDNKVFINSLTTEISNVFKTKSQYNNKLNDYITSIYLNKKITQNIYWIKLPLNIWEEYKEREIIRYIKKKVLIREKIILIPNIKINLLITELKKYYKENTLREKFYNIIQNSISLEHIKVRTDEFEKYLKYDDIYFWKEKKKISDFEKIREWKFINI